jgi:hypothetical protein
MALVNPNIALSIRPVELADPLAQYGKIAALQSAQNQNALAQYQLGAAQRGEARDIARANALAQAGSDETAVANALLKSGDIAGYSAFVKAAEDRRTQKLTQQKTEGEIAAQPLARQKTENELFDNSMKQIRNSWGNVRTPEEALMVHDATHRDPIINKRLVALGVTEEMGRRQILEAAQNPQTFAQFVQKAQLGAEKFMEMNKPQVVAPGSALVQGGRAVFTAPERQDTDLIRNFNAAKAQGFTGTIFDYERRIKEAGRPPAQPAQAPAPTITQIQDPTNPSQMITIDARSYRGGGVGSPGVIGTTGKAPAIAAAEQKKEEGATQARDILDTLRASYDELDRLRAVPSDQRGALSNAIAYVASTGVGQVAGRVAGTKEQTQRDVIASARNQMLNAIKNATGMSAQQLNSNVEFKSWLEALTDPTRSIEANRSILDNMEKFIASGGKYSAKKGGGDNAPAATPKLAPQDQEALNWANSNPNDPRSAQIKQRLGVR